MNTLSINELHKILKQADLTIYEVEAPDNIDGFKFASITNFVKFIKDCNIKTCFLSTIYSTIDNYIINEEMANEAIDVENDLGRKILKKIEEYNNSLKFVDFSNPEEILLVVLYEGKYFYFEHFNDIYLENQPLIEPEAKMEEILNLFNEELTEEINKRNDLIETQTAKLKEFILNDPEFKLCKNKSLRKSYIHNLFRNRLGDEFKDLKTYWFNHEINYLYKGVVNLVEMIWNEIKIKKQ